MLMHKSFPGPPFFIDAKGKVMQASLPLLKELVTHFEKEGWCNRGIFFGLILER
jgi:hypothetical protein